MKIKDSQSPYEKYLNRHYILKKFFKNIPGTATLYRMSNPQRLRYQALKDGEKDAEIVRLDKNIISGIRVAIAMDTDVCPYYSKFIRFCENNGITYKTVNMHQSDWFDQISDMDLLLWRPVNTQWAVNEAVPKIKLVEDTGMAVFPPLHDFMLYENKAMQYHMLREYGLPAPETFITHDYREAVDFVDKREEWPLVSKIKCGSASLGVKLMKNRAQALRFVNRSFRCGIRHSWHGNRQKGYVFFQDYIDNMGYDLRVYTAGDRLFGYYRFPGKNDFRASGAGKWAFDALPRDALETALRVRDGLGLADCAVDYVRDREGRLHIIEVSLFTLIDSPAQCRIDDVPGWYEKDGKGGFSFKEGQVWPHDLMLKRFLEDVFPPDESRGEKKRSPFSLFGVPAE